MSHAPRRVCTRCGLHRALNAECFWPSEQKTRTGLSSTCKRCPKPVRKRPTREHHRGDGAVRPKVCKLCLSIPWRRPDSGCPRCGQPHDPETLTMRQILERPHHAPERT